MPIPLRKDREAHNLDPALTAHLKDIIPSSRLMLPTVILQLLYAVEQSGDYLRDAGSVTQSQTGNAFGDTQLNVDIATENLIRQALSRCPNVVTASSEEDHIERSVEHEAGSLPLEGSTDERYAVAFDPLDGSSIIGANWTVGAIIGIWDGDTALGQNPREKQVVSILGVYGPRTTAIVAIRFPGAEPACFEVALTSKLSVLSKKSVNLSEGPFKTKYFAPANLRSAADSPQYAALVNHYLTNKYTLRYSGGLVPDVVHALVKGHGVYVSPVTATSKAKLRRLFELCPVAMVVECAGGKAVGSEDGEDVLAKAINNTEETGGLICGNVEEVDFAIKSLLG